MFIYTRVINTNKQRGYGFPLKEHRTKERPKPNVPDAEQCKGVDFCYNLVYITATDATMKIAKVIVNRYEMGFFKNDNNSSGKEKKRGCCPIKIVL